MLLFWKRRSWISPMLSKETGLDKLSLGSTTSSVYTAKLLNKRLQWNGGEWISLTMLYWCKHIKFVASRSSIVSSLNCTRFSCRKLNSESAIRLRISVQGLVLTTWKLLRFYILYFLHTSINFIIVSLPICLCCINIPLWQSSNDTPSGNFLFWKNLKVCFWGVWPGTQIASAQQHNCNIIEAWSLDWIYLPTIQHTGCSWIVLIYYNMVVIFHYLISVPRPIETYLMSQYYSMWLQLDFKSGLWDWDKQSWQSWFWKWWEGRTR